MKIRQSYINGINYYACNLPKDLNGKFRILYARSETELMTKYNTELQKMKMQLGDAVTVEELYHRYMDNTPLLMRERDILERNEHLINKVKDIPTSNITREAVTQWIESLYYNYHYETIVTIYRRAKRVLSYGNIEIEFDKPSVGKVKKRNNEVKLYFSNLITNEILLELQRRNHGMAMYLYVYYMLTCNSNSFIKACTLQTMMYKDLINCKSTGNYVGMKFSKELVESLEDYAKNKRLSPDSYLFENSAHNAVDGSSALRYMRDLLFEYGLPTNVVFEAAYQNHNLDVQKFENEMEDFISKLPLNENQKMTLRDYFSEYKNLILER